MAKDPRRYPDPELEEMDEVAEMDQQMPARRRVRLEHILVAALIFVAVLALIAFLQNKPS